MAKTTATPEPEVTETELTVEQRLEQVEKTVSDLLSSEKKPANIEEKIQHFKDFAKGLSNGEKIVFSNFLKSKNGRHLLAELKKGK